MKAALFFTLIFCTSVFAAPSQKAVRAQVVGELPSLLKLYQHLHANPEISFQEKETAKTLAAELRRAGFEVSTGIGGHGIVGVLKNGAGPTVLVRTDLDALPVKEATGLAFASKRTTTDDLGKTVPTMHACGHDVHMACWTGTARVLAHFKNDWSGTLVFIGQPAEERGAGAKAMLADGLFKNFPVPDYCLALHVTSDQPVGTLGFTSGFALANVDSVDITVRGVGGHGSQPQTAKDPIVLSAQIVLALQTIVSREIHPLEPAVVTVGSIHGGTKHNIIPDEVHLQLTLRSYSDDVRAKLIAAIRRIVKGQAMAAGLPEAKHPLVKVKDEFTPAAYNDPKLVTRINGVFKTWLGEGALFERKPTMGGEDFGRYGRTTHKIPIFMFRLGAVSPAAVKRAQALGQSLPSLHSAKFAPDTACLKTGVTAMTAAVLELVGKK
jgi:hippurate hydrolase